MEAGGAVSWAIREDEAPTLDSIFDLIANLPIEVLVFGPFFEYRTPRPPPGEWDSARESFSLSTEHQNHGFGVMFRGVGHDSLVSRRWLEHGPWLVRHLDNDTTWVQFHDSSADAASAWAQAARAHERMGTSDVGGYLEDDFLFETFLKGLYHTGEHSLTISQDLLSLSQLELLELCAYRAQKQGTEQPVERVRVLFWEGERFARRYVHELWLREIECWYIDPNGRELRIDDTYQPERILPEWVERAEGLAPRVAPVQVRLALGLDNLLGDPQDECPGGVYRDELLFNIIDGLTELSEVRAANYELREIIEAHLYRFNPTAGAIDAVMRAVGPVWTSSCVMPADEAKLLLAKVRDVQAQVDLSFDPDRLGLSLPAIIAPDPYPNQRPFRKECHPLTGVIVHPVGDVLARVRSLNREDLRDAEALLRLCADERLILSAVARKGKG
jgi:hypothetical protein